MATHNDARHLYATCRLKGKAGTVWQSETWQIGHRLAVSDSSPLDPDSGRQQLTEFSVSDAFVDRSNAEWNIAQGFAANAHMGATITDADQDAIVNGYYDFLVTIKALLASQFVVDSVRIYPVGADGKSRTAPSVYTPKVTTANPTGVNALPPDVAVAVSYGSATRGVKGRGRIYLGGLSTSTVAASGLLGSPGAFGTAATALLTHWRNIAKLPGQAAFTPILWHRKGDKLNVEDGTYGSPIRIVRVNDHADTQRRRDRQVTPTWTTYNL